MTTKHLYGDKTKQEWDGKGFPSVGTICEAYMNGKKLSDKALIMGYFDDLVWMNLQNWDKDGLYSGAPVTRIVGETEFRPLKSEQERQREEFVEVVCDIVAENSLDRVDQIAAKVFDDYLSRYSLEPKQ